MEIIHNFGINPYLKFIDDAGLPKFDTIRTRD